MNDSLVWAILIALGYLMGSIPFGLIIGLSQGIDPRAAGSGNIGATNVSRTVGRKAGALCFALDLLKGLLPPLAAGLVFGLLGRGSLAASEAWLWLATVAAPILGHIYPVWLRFKGGKGVATGFGALLGVWPVLTIPALLAFGAWVVCRRITKNVGLSSSVVAVLLPLLLAAMQAALAPAGTGVGEHLRSQSPFLIAACLLAGLVLWRHRENLARTFGWLPPRPGGPYDPAGPGEMGPGPGGV